MRYLTVESIEEIAVGAAVLGTGGGGDPYIGKLMAIEAIKKHGPVKLISLEELDDDALVVPVSGMGAPTVTIEKLPSQTELLTPIDKIEEVLNRKVDVIIPIEVGGINSLFPVVVAAIKGLPLLDADAMGRAFPEAQMVTFHLAGYNPSPVTMGDEKGNCVVLFPVDGESSERLARVLTVEMGGSASICDYSLDGHQVKKAVVRDTMTLAQNIGKILIENQTNAKEGVSLMLDKLNGYKLFEGKITDIRRDLDGGFTRGFASFSGINEFKGDYSVSFQNEHLLAKKGEDILCSTPDLIAILDFESGMPITTERMRYGARVIAVAFPCDQIWRTPKGIETAGPKYFGYDIDYVTVEELQEKRGNK